jgi:hypothetical protein
MEAYQSSKIKLHENLGYACYAGQMKVLQTP